MTATVQIRVDIGGKDGIPHSFLAVTHPDGTVTEYGLVPATHGSMSGPGEIDLTGIGLVEPHEYTFASQAASISDTQYANLIGFIGGSILSPPDYLVTGGWSSSNGADNCTGWAVKAWAAAGLETSFGLTNQGTWNPYGQALSLEVRYLSAKWVGSLLAFNANTFHSNIPSVDAMNLLVNTATTLALNWVAPRRDPLVLDLDGGGITTSGINPAAPILFDQDGDGTRTATGWIAAGEAIVVRDLNGNGLIDSGRELLGDNTILTHGPNAGQTAANGFAALADLDANASGVADGKFDSSDVAFSSVKLWKDLNQDGVSQSTELFTFAQLGVQSINVTGTASNVNLGGGNTQTFSGSFTRVGGQTGASGTAQLVGSLLLTNNNFYRQFTDDPALTPAALARPQMTGSGAVRDLRSTVRCSGGRKARTWSDLRMRTRRCHCKMRVCSFQRRSDNVVIPNREPRVRCRFILHLRLGRARSV